MRRESSTVVALVGLVTDGLLAGLTQSPNVSLAGAPALAAPGGASEPGWEAGARALREAARRRSTYVIVPADPLGDVAAGWQAMWDLEHGLAGAARFEDAAAATLAAWRASQFELPDYYAVVVPDLAGGADPDFYLGPLRAARPSRVVLASLGEGPDQAARLLDTLRSLPHGPWWPPLEELLEMARRFYAGGLTVPQPVA